MLNYAIVQKKLDEASKITLLITGFAIPISITAFNIFVILTIILSLLAGNWKAKYKPLLSNRVLLIILTFFLLLLLSIPYSSGAWPEIAIALQKYRKLLFIPFLMPLFMDMRWRRWGVSVFLAAMIVTLAVSFMKMFGWVHIKGGLGTIFTNHINTGFLMAFAAFIVAHRCFEKNRWQWFYWILLIVFVYHIFFMNEGRTGFLVFSALLIVFLWQKFSWKGLLASIVLLPLLAGSLFWFSHNFQTRVKMIDTDINNYHQQQLKDNSIGLRMNFTKNSLKMIAKHPVVGTGVGSFKQEYLQNFPPDPGFAGMKNPQNEFLLIGVQLGILGILMFLWIFYAQWCYSFLLPADLKYLAQGMVIAFLVGSWCDSFLYLAITGYFFVYFTALFFAPMPRVLKQK